jgi:hypothetical protein
MSVLIYIIFLLRIIEALKHVSCDEDVKKFMNLTLKILKTVEYQAHVECGVLASC